MKSCLKYVQIGLLILAGCVSCSRPHVTKEIQSLCNSAYMECQSGDYAAAFTNANKAIELGPKLATPYLLRGMANAGLNQFTAAIKDDTTAINHYPNYELAYDIEHSAKIELNALKKQ
jgi:regulator of sirC expression with transglutaminase-like and TPR domain